MSSIEYIDFMGIEEDFRKASEGDVEAREIVDKWFKESLDRKMRMLTMSEQDKVTDN